MSAFEARPSAPCLLVTSSLQQDIRQRYGQTRHPSTLHAGLGEYLSPAALPEKGFFEAPNAVVVQKGDTELLPIKFDIQFVTDIQTLIEVIKCGALLSIEVFHSAARAGEHIVGRAHVPLQPLLSETWVQGKAPVWANMYDGTHSQICILHTYHSILQMRLDTPQHTMSRARLTLR